MYDLIVTTENNENKIRQPIGPTHGPQIVIDLGHGREAFFNGRGWGTIRKSQPTTSQQIVLKLPTKER